MFAVVPGCSRTPCKSSKYTVVIFLVIHHCSWRVGVLIGVLHLCLPDPGHGEPIPATRVHPFARTRVTVLAERPSGVRWGTPLPGPDREGVPLQLVDVVEGITRVAVEARLYLLARLGTERPFVPDNFDALNPLAGPPEIDALDEEEAALHPLVGDRPPHVPGELPGADQPVLALEF